jgi:hypothetical protein
MTRGGRIGIGIVVVVSTGVSRQSIEYLGRQHRAQG